MPCRDGWHFADNRNRKYWGIRTVSDSVSNRKCMQKVHMINAELPPGGIMAQINLPEKEKCLHLHSRFWGNNKLFCNMSDYLNSDKKQEIFGKYGKSNTDTGSPESQIALFSYRINHLTEHMRSNKKDHNTQRALLRLVGKRRRLLDYLKDRDIERYRAILKELDLRK